MQTSRGQKRSKSRGRGAQTIGKSSRCIYRYGDLIRSMVAALLMVLISSAAPAGEVLPTFPKTPDTDQRYIIYVHGRIIETEGVDPVSPRFGLYAYGNIVAALARREAHVIAPLRVGDTDPFHYADFLTQEIIAMISHGVPPQNITLVGFSKGGYITLLTAKRLQNPSLRYVVMAGCTSGVVDGRDRRAEGLQGSILSMVDVADDLGFSCGPLFARNPQLSQADDMTFHAGTAHGFFYRADPAWINEVFSWSEAGAT